jgi:hypothetical protein
MVPKVEDICRLCHVFPFVGLSNIVQISFISVPDPILISSVNGIKRNDSGGHNL